MNGLLVTVFVIGALIGAVWWMIAPPDAVIVPVELVLDVGAFYYWRAVARSAA